MKHLVSHFALCFNVGCCCCCCTMHLVCSLRRMNISSCSVANFIAKLCLVFHVYVCMGW